MIDCLCQELGVVYECPSILLSGYSCLVTPELLSCAPVLCSRLGLALTVLLPATDGIDLASIEIVSKDLILCQVLIPEQRGRQGDNGKGMDCRHHMDYQVIHNQKKRDKGESGLSLSKCKCSSFQKVPQLGPVSLALE